MTKAKPGTALLGTALLALAAIGTSGCERSPGNVALTSEGSPDASASAPALTTLPARTRPDREAWRAQLAWPEDCERAFALTDASEDSGLVVHELEAGRMLIEVRCAAGAYQPSAVLMQVDASRTPPVARVLSFE